MLRFPCSSFQRMITSQPKQTYKKHIDCRLLALILKIVDVRAADAFCCIRQNPFETAFMHDPLMPLREYCSPASVRFPLLVKLVFKAPVPAYIFDNESPFSAHSSRWCVQSELGPVHSRRTRSKCCSRVVFESISCTKFVRSRLDKLSAPARAMEFS